MAVFGAKNPHTQFLVAGGVTCYESLTPERIAEFEGLYKEVNDFVNQVYIPDLLLVGGAYKDWTKIGGTTNFMTFGEFPGDERNLESRWFKPGVVFDRKLEALPFDPSKIEEHVRHSWYAGDAVHKPFQGVTEPKFTFMGDKDRYSWMKAPRYDGRAVETGPLAQVLVAYLKGNAEVVPVVESVLQTLSLTPGDLFSTLGRTAARGIETAVIAKKTGEMLQEYKENVASGDKKIVENCEVPDQGRRRGLRERAPRRALPLAGHREQEGGQLPACGAFHVEPRPALLEGHPERGGRGAREHAHRRSQAPGRNPAHGPFLRPLHRLRGARDRRQDQ